MRFQPNGADIPDSLISASTSGDVIFLCGAGVSIRSGLPLFKGLTEHVYEVLGETAANEASEQAALDHAEYDRALRSLEKRTHVPGAPRSRVREAVTKRLQAPEGGVFPAHAALLRISKDADGRPRLLTTNFDTLFERSAATIGFAGIESHAGKSIPKPGAPRDFGVFHLHGRIGDQKLNLEQTDLILTSADFGDAYLRDGWASQYIEDLMRLRTLVLIGYRAEDAAFRLLLETLDADRNRFRDLNEIYAIEKGEVDSASFWRAKGIIPLEFVGYDEVYTTLTEWANYADKPIDYARKRLETIIVKSPEATNEFEREQIRFFLRQVDLATTLADINPPIVWISELTKWNVIEFDDRKIMPWVDRNLTDVQATCHVVANIHHLGPNAAEYLERRLVSQHAQIPPILIQSWRLIIRHLRNVERAPNQLEWFELKPRLERGDNSHEVLERVADVLRPRLKIGRRWSLYRDRDISAREPTDLMSVEYAAGDEFSENDVLGVWPQAASAEADTNLLNYLVRALDATLADAMEVGVEREVGRGASDIDVRSVADHPQNRHHSGFLKIVRVVAELWNRLAHKDGNSALTFVNHWRTSRFRLLHRLALYACTDPIVSADLAADVLIDIPLGELFLTSATVEVYRLIEHRWRDFSPNKRMAIEQKLCSGPPRNWFREGTDVDEHVDRSRFDILGHMERLEFPLSEAAVTMLTGIRQRWPQWALRPAARAGFHTWSSSGRGIVGDSTKLLEIPDDRLVAEAIRVDAAAPFGDGGSWRALCNTEPDRALRGLEEEAKVGRWPTDAWTPYFWECGVTREANIGRRIARILFDWPDEKFGEIEDHASAWLLRSHGVINDDGLWKLWDKIFHVASDCVDSDKASSESTENFLNTSAGRLAEIVVERMVRQEGEKKLTNELRQRMDRIIETSGNFGKLARVPFAVHLSLVFTLAPKWTTEKMLPLFEWSSPEAAAMWSARSLSNEIGVPELVRLTKAPFLQLFSRAATPPEQLSVFGEWLAAIAIDNQTHDAGYPLTLREIRSALRKAGENSLHAVAHTLAMQMEGVSSEAKAMHWRGIVGPVFQGIWPLDIDLQTPALTFKLVQILRATGEAFGEAADVVIPFIRPDRPGRHTTIYSVSTADDILFTSFPAKMLELVTAIVGNASPADIYSLDKVLTRISVADSELAETHRFQKLCR